MRLVEPGDADIVAQLMRPVDRMEVYALGLLTPRMAVNTSIANAEHVWTGTFGEEVALICGVSGLSTLSDVGVPWMLGTALVEKHPMAFLRCCRPVVDMMRAEFQHLENHVHAGNAVTIKWLRWLGFDVEDPRPYGALGEPFCRFTVRS